MKRIPQQIIQQHPSLLDEVLNKRKKHKNAWPYLGGKDGDEIVWLGVQPLTAASEPASPAGCCCYVLTTRMSRTYANRLINR